MLRLDLDKTYYKEIAPEIQRLNRSKRDRLLLLCERAFSELDLRKDTRTRVAAAEVMVALVPDSADSIRRWINTRSGKYIYEVHFSLFCFMDLVLDLPRAEEFAAEIIALVEKYLMGLESDRASAGWMAGDLLGNHWNTEEALPILVKAAKEARFVAGRDAAVDGLGYILQSLQKSDPRRKSIISLLREIAANDRSKNVKAAARNALNLLKKRPMPGKKN
ncbi:MAG: hypothetical protein FJ004_06100 [Chloroflexi bacterium]|nr:hypothetical protein [Chloroflexota bacterium]